jgi:hypothetical protein
MLYIHVFTVIVYRMIVSGNIFNEMTSRPVMADDNTSQMTLQGTVTKSEDVLAVKAL